MAFMLAPTDGARIPADQRRSAVSRGLMDFGFSLLANAGQPLGQAIGQAGRVGLQSYDAAVDDIMSGQRARREEEQFEAEQAERARLTELQQRQQAAREAYGQVLAQSSPELAALYGANPAAVEQMMAGAAAPLTAADQARIDQGNARLALDRDRLGLAREEFAHEQRTGGSQATTALMTRAQKIQDAMRLNNMTEAEATALVDSQTQVVTDPVSGQSMMFNRATGEAVDIDTPTETVPPIEATTAGARPATIQEMAQETGLIPTMKDFWSRTAGQFDPALVDQAKAEARTQHNFVKTRLRKALMNSPRGAVWEQQQIDALLPVEGIFESPGRAEAIYRTAKDALVRQHNYNRRMINSGEMTADVEQKLRESNVDLQFIYEMMPDAADLPPEPPDVPTGPRDGDVDPASLTQQQIDAMSADEIEAMLARMPR